jgi:hypothetical protein
MVGFTSSDPNAVGVYELKLISVNVGMEAVEGNLLLALTLPILPTIRKPIRNIFRAIWNFAVILHSSFCEILPPPLLFLSKRFRIKIIKNKKPKILVFGKLMVY